MFGREPKPVFVTVNQPQRTEYVTREVIEKRAPTDESVKLLREMEQSALSEVVKAVRVKDNDFECVIQSMMLAEQDAMRYRVIFSMNGQKHTATVDCDRPDAGPDRLHDIADDLREAVAKEIALKILAGAFKDLKFGRA